MSDQVQIDVRGEPRFDVLVRANDQVQYKHWLRVARCRTRDEVTAAVERYAERLFNPYTTVLDQLAAYDRIDGEWVDDSWAVVHGDGSLGRFSPPHWDDLPREPTIVRSLDELYGDEPEPLGLGLFDAAVQVQPVGATAADLGVGGMCAGEALRRLSRGTHGA